MKPWPIQRIGTQSTLGLMSHDLFIHFETIMVLDSVGFPHMTYYPQMGVSYFPPLLGENRRLVRDEPVKFEK